MDGGKPSKDARRQQGSQRTAKSHDHGGSRQHRDHGQPPRRPPPKKQPDQAEEEAVEEARLQAEGAGVHHQHVVNKGLDASRDVHDSVAAPAGGPGETEPNQETQEQTPPPQLPPVRRYVPKGDNDPVEAGVRDGSCVIGRLQLKSWTNAVAFVKSRLFPWDVFVGGIENRSGALPGDIVVVRLKPRSEWKPSTRVQASEANHTSTLHRPDEDGALPRLADGRRVEHVLEHDAPDRPPQDDVERLTLALAGKRDFSDWPANLQPEGQVIAVLERRFDRIQCCRFFAGRDQQGPVEINPSRWYRFKSYSDDFPVVAVFGRDIPTTFRDDVGKYLFLVVVDSDPHVKFVDNGRFPIGRIHASLGQTGTVEAESASISFSHKIKDAPFSPEVEECVMRDFVIPDAAALREMGRRDLRQEEFVCTIDPATARDLDDALSIAKTQRGFRVGVHIADVSHFVPIGTALDEEARERGTSTYYIERVIPMLPRRLCEDYCSLNAGVDKFAFSGIWEFDFEGNVVEEWFGQSVIRNRCRMAYEDAQRIIDGDESGDSLVFVNEAAPREELVRKVVKSVKLLQALALKLRQRRFDRGALSLNKGKLKFIFEDFNSRLAPKGLSQERSKAANFLVEEFMLHANCRVGEKIVQYLPECAMLRKHDPPVKKKLNNMVQAAAKFGFTINPSSSKTLRDSLDEYRDHPDIDSLRFMATICMSLAKYTSSNADKKTSVSHFALAAPIYTHFTSPIRRYADLVVHRQLLLALDIERALVDMGYTDEDAAANKTRVAWQDLDHAHYYVHPSDVENIAEHCNQKKEAAKKAGEASSALFLCLFIRAIAQKSLADPSVPGKLVVRGVVVRIEEQKFTVYFGDVAMTQEVFHNSPFQRWADANRVEEDNSGFVVNWGQHPVSKDVTTEKFTLFSQVLVTLDAVVRGRMELQATIHPPWERDPHRITPLDFEL